MHYLSLLVSIAIAQSAGIVGSFFTASQIEGWYQTILKPEWNPPSWVFGPVWITLYTLMGIAAWRVWQKRKEQNVAPALSLYGVHLVFNAGWSIIFFGMQNIEYAFYWILLLLVLLILTMYLFFKVDRVAGYLLVPYLLWVLFASYLNYSIFVLN